VSVTDELRDYQQQAVEFVYGREGSALFFEQGTGKTHVITALIERLMRDATQSILLVVPLPNLETTWVRMLSRVEGLTICRAWDEFKAMKGTHRVLLINYERVRSIIRRLKTVTWTLASYDESQRLKKRSSKQSKDAARLTALRKVILSGTPIEQCPQDLWAQFRFILPEVFGTKWASFEARWMKRTGYMGYELKFRQEKLPKFLSLIDPHILRVRRVDVLDLPKMRYVRTPVDLLGDQGLIYRQLTRDDVAEIGDRRVTCDMAITKLVRQQQVCGGFVRVDPSRDERAEANQKSELTGKTVVAKGPFTHVGSAKLRKLRAIVRREERRPLVIFCQYVPELVAIRKLLTDEGMTVGVVSGKGGKTMRRRRTGVIESFQRGELDALVCQIRAGGVGLDLQRACVAIFYSCTWSWIDFDQAVTRLHRFGQNREVTIYLIFARNTVDAQVYKALLLKKSVTQLILNRKEIQMAKKDKANAASDKKPAEKAKPTPPPQPPKPKYGVPELAEAMGVKTSSVRVKLRAAGIEKSGKLYGWDSKAEMQEVITKLKATGGRKKANADEGDDEEEEDGEEE
jgi:SNF2 family DNA or RNA helicase